MGEVIKFESKNEKTGFHELEEFFLKLDNYYQQSIETKDGSTLKSDIDKSKDSEEIANRISGLIDDLDCVRPGMPSIAKFTILVNKFLELPFGEYVPNNIGYLGLTAMAQMLTEKYRRKLEAMQSEQFTDALN